MLKRCNKCRVQKRTTEFSPNGRDGGFHSICKKCKNAQQADFYKKNGPMIRDRVKRLRNPTKVRERAILRIYGITQQEYQSLFDRQNGVCLICQTKENRIDYRTGKVQPLLIDHDKFTGNIRGLLCNKCNSAIGFFDHNIDRILTAATYLKEHGLSGGPLPQTGQAIHTALGGIAAETVKT